uniref:TPT domain-containing protein n=1 Tax=Heterorhabditis bacteriophora TaxID=37862 RepID=A0A1I7XPQ9_HETBA
MDIELVKTYPYPMTLALSNLMCVPLYSIPLLRLWEVKTTVLTTAQYNRYMLPISIGKALAVASAYFTLWKVPISYAHTVKASMPFFAVFLSKFVLKERQSYRLLKESEIHPIRLLAMNSQLAAVIFFPFWLFRDARKTSYETTGHTRRKIMTSFSKPDYAVHNDGGIKWRILYTNIFALMCDAKRTTYEDVLGLVLCNLFLRKLIEPLRSQAPLIPHDMKFITDFEIQAMDAIEATLGVQFLGSIGISGRWEILPETTDATVYATISCCAIKCTGATEDFKRSLDEFMDSSKWTVLTCMRSKPEPFYKDYKL